jgi:hypothetical protein
MNIVTVTPHYSENSKGLTSLLSENKGDAHLNGVLHHFSLRIKRIISRKSTTPNLDAKLGITI